MNVEAGDALSPADPLFVKLGCARCSEDELQQACGDLDEYHPCLCDELMGGGLNSVRAMGWLRGPSSQWSFHVSVQNRATCVLAGDGVGAVSNDGTSTIERTGFCCRD